MGKLKLYDHQKEAILGIEEQFSRGSKRTLAVLATGTGKTIIYLSLIDKWVKAGKRVLVLAHRRELIHQPIERAEEFYPDLVSRMGVVMSKLNSVQARVVIATVQTLSRSPERIEEILSYGEFDYVILDEAHHGTAETYLKLVDSFPNSRWLGLTATPFRTDGDSLARIFDSIAYRYPITAAINGGSLVSFDAFGFVLPVSVRGITETINGWAEEALGELLSAENAIEVVFEKWLEYCQDRLTICFTASVAQAHATAEYFRDRGVSAEAIDGTTPKKSRDDILEKFREGEIQMVANCQVWTEGVDVPEASAALMVCPTRSDLAYVQKLGRVLRIHENKKNAIVLDFAPLEDRNIVMAGDILGVPRMVQKEVDMAIKGGMLVGASRVDDHGLAVSVDPTDIIIKSLKYLRRELLAWTLQDYVAVASLSDIAMLAIELPNVRRIAAAEDLRKNGNWNKGKEKLYRSLLLYRLWVCRKEGRFWKANYAGGFDSMEDSVEFSETFTELEYQPALAKKRQIWRKRLASSAQLMYMARLGILIPEECKCGQAAQLISYAVANRAVVKARTSMENQIVSEV